MCVCVCSPRHVCRDGLTFWEVGGGGGDLQESLSCLDGPEVKHCILVS